MKLDFLYILILGLFLSVNVWSQNLINIQKTNVPIREVFKEVKKQTGLIIMYNEEEIPKELKISVSLKNTELKDAFKLILDQTNLTYELVDDYILIKPLPPVSVQPLIVPETMKISGNIKDDNGNPIPFVSIQVKGESIGIISDEYGLFELELELNENIVLIFSSIGYETVEFKYFGQKDVEITMKVRISDLVEVVVTGYQTLSRERVTGSFGQVKSTILDKETSVNLTTKLEGKVAGLLIDKNNDGTIKVQIRGQSTLFANQEPLVVVDGLPIEGGWESIDPNTVQSVNVLKDAAAASVWGTRAANGVIVITTKGGSLQTKETSVSANYSTTIGNMYELSDLQLASSSDLVDF